MEAKLFSTSSIFICQTAVAAAALAAVFCVCVSGWVAWGGGYLFECVFVCVKYVCGRVHMLACTHSLFWCVAACMFAFTWNVNR